MMFSLFGKKEKQTRVIDKVFLSRGGKARAIEKFAAENNLVVIAWFEASFDAAMQLLPNKAEIFLAREVNVQNIQNKKLVFFEHHPILSKEQELFKKLHLTEAIFFGAIEEPLFTYFGGEKIGKLMEQMGMQADEAVEHSLISSSIKNAQKKISEKIEFESDARSQEEWFAKNLPR
jgi:hypothetical protein